MNKLVWVFLPLLAAALLAGALALRGRLPTRARLNAISSLLLLVYLLATAGLGIFWVANQHLPVFDWHYLFGYATVLLLVLHLVFNLRALLAALLEIEHRHGRARSFRNAPRTLDLDLLLYGDARFHEDGLALPHPRMHARAFVLVPLLEIAPEATIPGRGRAADWLAVCQDQSLARLQPPAATANA